jgi:hypothetical protein
VLITNNYIAAETMSYIGLVMGKESGGRHKCTLHFFFHEVGPEI